MAFKFKYVNVVNDPIAKGTVPLNMLLFRTRVFRFVNNPIVAGIVDVRRIPPSNRRKSRYRKLPIVDGKVPSIVAALNDTEPIALTRP